MSTTQIDNWSLVQTNLGYYIEGIVVGGEIPAGRKIGDTHRIMPLKDIKFRCFNMAISESGNLYRLLTMRKNA